MDPIYLSMHAQRPHADPRSAGRGVRATGEDSEETLGLGTLRGPGRGVCWSRRIEPDDSMLGSFVSELAEFVRRAERSGCRFWALGPVPPLGLVRGSASADIGAGALEHRPHLGFRLPHSGFRVGLRTPIYKKKNTLRLSQPSYDPSKK